MPGDGYAGTLLAEALEYLKSGFSVVSFKMEGDKKKAAPPTWKEYQTELPAEEVVKGWFSGPEAKERMLAVILGPVSHGCWVLDLDGPDPIAWMEARAAEGRCPETGWKAVTPNGGEHWWYRMPPGSKLRNDVDIFRGIFGPHPIREGKLQAIDIRAEGGTAIVPPSRRPDDGREYLWKAREGLPPEWNILNSGLYAECHASMKMLFRSRKEESSSPEPGEDPPERCPGRRLGDPVPKGQRNATLAEYVGVWFRRYRMDKRTALLAALRWNQENDQPMTENRVRATVESIARTHERNHGVKVSAAPSPPGGGTATLEAEDEIPPDPEEEDFVEDAVPEDFKRPGGLIGDVMDYVSGGYHFNVPLFSHAVALCLTGTLVGEKIRTDTGLRTNVYAMGLSRSGTGKEAAISATRALMGRLDLALDHLGDGNIPSAAGLLKSLTAQGNQLILMDEIGDFVGSVNSFNNPHKTELNKTLKELFTCEGWVRKRYANSKQDYWIPWHHVSFFGTGTPDALWRNVTVNDVSGGLLGRMLIFSLNLKKRAAPERPISREVPPGLAVKIQALAGLERKMRYGKGDFRYPDPSVIGLAPDASRLLADFDAKYTEIQNGSVGQDHLDTIYARAAEHARKLSLVYAVSRAAPELPGKVEACDAERAIRLVDWSVPRTAQMIRDNVSYNRQDALRRRILAAIRKRGGVKTANAARLVRDCSHRELEDAVRLMIEAKEIVKRSVDGKGMCYVPWERRNG
ncbi:MAG: bifunctional DNA primase/polymerase [Deltaproteobacteria bacterium]|jgi:hypothetical protein|nr:bifunctional DNA primase/polymerase [Deltaproteobacteria bacterium]